MDEQKILRDHLLSLLQGGNAHASLEDAIAGLPPYLRNVKPDGLPFSIWQLLEHLRIAQYDILEFSRNPDYRSPKWPDGYWPEETYSEELWDQTIHMVQRDHKEMLELIADPANDLLAPFPHGNGQTLFREAVLLIDHNAYHIGQIIMLRRLLKDW